MADEHVDIPLAFDENDWKDVIEKETSEEEETSEQETEEETEVEEEETTSEEEETDTETEEESEVQPNGKKPQTKEDNARFAEERRQKQLQEALEKSEEFQTLKAVAAAAGMTVPQYKEAVKQAQLQQEAQQAGVPVTVMQEMQAQKQQIEHSQAAHNQVLFQMWDMRMESEAEKLLQGDYKFLNKDDIKTAKEWLLQNTRDPLNATLESALYAVHGKRLVQEARKTSEQEVLANSAGRKKSQHVAPSKTKSQQTGVVSPEIEALAKRYNMDPVKYAESIRKD